MEVGLWMGLFVVGILFIAADFFIPSAGVLSLLGVAGMVLSIVMLFSQGDYIAGTSLIIFAVVAVPLIVVYGFGRLTLNTSLPEVEGTMKEMEDPAILGVEGVALTPLRPAGAAEIAEKRRDVVAEGRFVEPGEKVKVVHIEGNKIVVRKSE